MSSGHRHKGKSLGDREVDLALAHPAVRKQLARTRRIDRTQDMPYLGGYSQDGRTVYLDRHLPEQFYYRGRPVHLDKFLVLHEEVEKALIDELRFTYDHAHEVATRAEEDAVRAAGIDIPWYRHVLAPMIKSDEHKRLLRVPRDLDLTPVRAPPVNRALVERIEHAQEHPSGGRFIRPAEAHYGPGHPGSRCDLCAYFIRPSGCTVLQRARADMWCEWFTRAYQAQSQQKERSHAHA